MMEPFWSPAVATAPLDVAAVHRGDEPLWRAELIAEASFRCNVANLDNKGWSPWLPGAGFEPATSGYEPPVGAILLANGRVALG